MKMYKVVIIWFVMWSITWTALLADSQQRHYAGYECKYYRSDLGFSMFIGAVPLSWIMVPFMTGFYEYGFQIFPDDNCKKELTTKN